MRLLLLPLVLVAVLTLGARGGSAEVESPIETATPTVTFEQSEIQLYFLQNFWPQYWTYHVKKIEADGVVCAEGIDGGDVYWERKSNDYIFSWPLDDWDGEEACGPATPKTIRVTFGAPWAYVAELVWPGGDQSYSVHMQPTQNGTVTARRQVELETAEIRITYTYRNSLLVSSLYLETYLDNAPCSGVSPGRMAVSWTTKWPLTDYNPCADLGGLITICTRWPACSEPFVFQGGNYEVEVAVEPWYSVATATFMFDGEPVELSVDALRLYNDGVACESLLDLGRPLTSQLSFHVGCGPGFTYGDVITAEFDFVECRGLTGSYMWDGTEPSIDVEVRPDCLGIVSPSPTEVATQVPLPSVLPQAGGPPSHGRSSNETLLLLLAGLGAGCAAIYASKRNHPR